MNLAATLWNNFSSSSEKVILLSDFFRRITPFCRSTQFTDLACFGPPTSSVPGVATPLTSVNPKAFKARETCCWSGSYSILHCRNVSVLHKKLTVRDCADSGPRVTTLLNSYAPRNKLSTCLRPSRRPTMKKSSPCTRKYVFVLFLETIRTGTMRVIHITVNIEETQILRIKFVLVLSYLNTTFPRCPNPAPQASSQLAAVATRSLHAPP